MEATNGSARGSPEASKPTTAFKSLLRAEIESALRPPKAAAQLAEAEAQVAQLLGRPWPGGGGRSPPAVPSEPLAREVLRQVQEADAAAKALPEEKPPPPAARRLLVQPEAGREADVLRQQVADGRRRLRDYDREVTKLTKQLKQSRTAVWEQQRLQSASEAGLARLIADRIAELPSGTAEEFQKADAEARELAQNLSEARTQASRWSSMAKRQDTSLQQEMEANGSDLHHSLIARHPAGEVFLVRQYHRDIDSEDDYSDDPRGYGIRRQTRLDDADMTSEEDTPTTATGGGPRGVRPRVLAESAQDSDGSSMPPSPSDGPSSASAGASGGAAAALAAAAAAGRGGAAQRKGDTSSDEEEGSSAGPSSASAGASGGVAASLAAAASGRNGGYQRKADTSSDEESGGAPPPRGALATAHLAAQTLAGMAGSKEGGSSGPPGAAAQPRGALATAQSAAQPFAGKAASDIAVSRSRPVVRADEAQEVSSEEDIDVEYEESDGSM